MYSTAHLFGTKLTGGLKRFLELYNGIKDIGVDVDLFSADTPKVLKDNNVSGCSLANDNISATVFIPTGLKVLISNMRKILKIKKTNYSSVIVFDVPTAIGINLVGIRNIQLFIRQDLIAYKEIELKERTNSKILIALYLKFMILCESICFIRAERIVLQCKYDRNALVKRHRLIKKLILRKSIIQINNVNPSWIVSHSKMPSENAAKSTKEDKSAKFLVGFIGDFSNERKGHKIFVDAIIGLLNKGLALEAILVGDGRLLSAYKEKCRNYSAIKFTGRLENPIALLREFDLMVVSSLADSCPNTVMEALYNEIPVIGAHSGGIPEILMNQDSIFEPNPLSLQNMIEHYTDKNNLSVLRTVQSFRKKELEFDWNVTVTKKIMLTLTKDPDKSL